MVEKGQRGVDEQNQGEDVVNLHHIVETEDTEFVWFVDDQPSEEQSQDYGRLYPMP